MKEISAKIIIVLVDMFTIALALMVAYMLRTAWDVSFAESSLEGYVKYLTFYEVYVTVFASFMYENIYIKRYDFWHESRQVIKGLMLSFLIVLSILALTQTMTDYSRAVIILAFLLMVLFIPMFKNITKKWLYKVGLWRHKIKMYKDASFVEDEIVNNPYLGYVITKEEDADSIFINAYDVETEGLGEILNKEIAQNTEVLFIPRLRQFDLTQSDVYQLSNEQANLISLRNRLNSRYRICLKQIYDITLAILITPLILPLIAFIAYKIKKEEPAGSVFFKQERLGKNGNIFTCYKFRSMREDGDGILEAYLKEHPEEVENYKKYHKYENDPRITKIGDKLRRTSLDELPQIFNVYKREMSFIGPRPYMLNEKEKIGDALDTVLMVRPGITGLWQVSGRSDVDFHARVKLDVWYIRNWNLWMNFVILLKTIRTVLFRDGAS